MKKFLTPTTIAKVLLAMIFSVGCKKTSTPLSGNYQPTITSVGIPVDGSLTETIGVSGGTITSADGLVELIFPANALSSNTEISIQTISNFCPGGNKMAYRFGPEGTQFNQPVTLNWHYNSNVLQKTIAEMMGLAYQDKMGAWYQLKNVKNDTIKKMLSASIMHFSDYAFFLSIFIAHTVDSLGTGKIMDLHIEYYSDGESTDFIPEDASATISIPDHGAALKKCTWSVNGNATNMDAGSGRIAYGQGSTIISYQAPKMPPDVNPVNISADMDLGGLKFGGKTFSNTKLTTGVMILTKGSERKEFNYTIFTDIIEYYGENIVLDIDYPNKNQIYKDRSRFDLKMILEDQIGGPSITASISNIFNYPPTVKPAYKTYVTKLNGLYTLEWIPDPVGKTNINEVRVISFYGTSFLLELIHNGSQTPAFKFHTSIPDSSGTIPSVPVKGSPNYLQMELNNEIQFFYLSGPLGSIGVYPK